MSGLYLSINSRRFSQLSVLTFWLWWASSHSSQSCTWNFWVLTSLKRWIVTPEWRFATGASSQKWEEISWNPRGVLPFSEFCLWPWKACGIYVTSAYWLWVGGETEEQHLEQRFSLWGLGFLWSCSSTCLVLVVGTVCSDSAAIISFAEHSRSNKDCRWKDAEKDVLH